MSTAHPFANPKSLTIRRARIKRGPTSYRPGLQFQGDLSDVSVRELEIHFIVSAADELGTATELTAIKKLRDDLKAATDWVIKASISVDTNEFKVKCYVRAAVASDDDLLTNTFLRLKPVIDSSEVLQTGFCSQLPSWQAIKGGNFVADEGTFVPETTSAAMSSTVPAEQQAVTAEQAG